MNTITDEDFQKIRRSQYLSWLFNSEDDHGMGSWFLKSFLLRCAESNGNSLLFFEKKKGFQSHTLDQIKNFDLGYVSSKGTLTTDKTAVSVYTENDIAFFMDEGESAKKKFEASARLQKDWKILYVLFEGDTKDLPENTVKASYTWVFEILEEAIKGNKVNPNKVKEILSFINQQKQNLNK